MDAPSGRLGSILISPFALFIFSAPFCSDFMVRHVYFVTPSLFTIYPDPNLCVHQVINPQIPELQREFEPGRSISVSSRYPRFISLCWAQSFDCNPLSTAAANGKRIQVIGHSGATLKPARLNCPMETSGNRNHFG